MVRLFLFRHGLAWPHDTPGMEDDERSLTEKGERRVCQVARGLKRMGLKLDKIVTSPLPRAAKTAEIVADVLSVPYLLEDSEILRPESSASEIAAWLKTRGEKRIMLVGHNPNLSELLSLLTFGQTEPLPVVLKKAGVAALRDDPAGRFHIDWIARPRFIRRLREL